MPRHFSEQQVEQVVATIKRESPELWESMKEVMRAPFDDNDEKITRNLRALDAVFNKLPFIAASIEPDKGTLHLLQDVNAVAAAEVKAESTEL